MTFRSGGRRPPTGMLAKFWGVSMSLLRLAAVAAVLLFVLPIAHAATPASGTITSTARSLTYTFPAEPRANASNNIEGTDPNYVCSPSDVPYACDTFELTVTLPTGYMAAHPNDILLIEPAVTTSQSDIDSQLETEDGVVLTVTRDNPPSQPTIRWVPQDGTTVYLVQVVPGTPHEGGTTNVTLVAGDPPPPPGAAYAPVFQQINTPPAVGDSAGEPSIGFNTKTNRGLFQASLQTLRYTLPEHRKDDPLNPNGLPESCDVQWEDVTSATTGTITLDPIGFVDPVGGRGYAGQLGPKQHTMSFTDDDGDSWSPSLGNFPGASGVDHQTIGYGFYVPGGAAGPLTAYPNPIYYCAQDIAYANCARSDDGGMSFLPPVTAYTVADCGGLHGHIRGGPDGTMYLPNKSCNNNQGVAVSEDNGLTWAVRRVPDSGSGNTDPQLALATDNTGYFCYVDGTGVPKVAVTRDHGRTFSNSFNLGIESGIKNAVFAQGIAGDGMRGACGFIGTTTAGNSDAEDFPGVWYAYIAVTYDRGKTWSMTKVSDDPVQGAGGICTSGTTCGANRNLLDFNEMAIDDEGYPLLGYADGCIGACVKNPTAINRSDKAGIMRAVGGKSLYAAKDKPEPRVSQAPCLAGTRTAADGVNLSWRAPAYDGRSSVTGYKIYRGTTAAAQSLLVGPLSVRYAFEDTSADPGEPEYFYKIVAVNAQGDSVYSNLIKLPIGTGNVLETACKAPGLTILEDAEGDPLDGQASHDVRKLSVAQPYFPNGDYKVYFTLKVASLATVPPNTIWPVAFCSPAFKCVNPDVNTEAYGPDNKYYTVQMSTVPPATSGAPVFQILQPTAAGTTAGSRTTIAAEPESTFNADGTITIIVKASDIGLTKPGAGVEKLGQFQVRVSVNGVAVNPTPDNMPDGLAGAGEYVTQLLDACAPNESPLAVLNIDKQTGPAPLTVNFDAAGSTDPDGDSIATYTFDFGDGSLPVSQSSPSISHTYQATGDYNATLRVRDNRGLASVSKASRVIQVVAAPEGPVVPGNNVLGGALGFALLLPLAVAGLARRRRR